MKIVQLTIDNREHYRQYDQETPWFGTAPEALLQGFAELPEVEVHVVSCTQQPMKSPAKLAENIYFHSLLVPKLGWLRTGYQGCIRAVRKKVRELQPDIVHGQGTERDAALGAVFSGFPNVVTIHGNMASIARHLQARPGSYLWIAGHLENFTLPRTAGVFCNSAYTESVVRPRNRRTWRVPNAVRKVFFAASPVPRPPTSQPRLINIGVISPHKRQVELLSFFKRLHQKGFPGTLDFIGTCSPNDSYCARFLENIQEAQEAGYARYLGPFSLEALVAEIDRSDACIHVASQESFGLVVAEVLARNLKLFASFVGGIPDIAQGADGAELIACDDWEALEARLDNWIQQGCPKPISAAPLMAERYHPHRIALRHLEIYREVIEK